MSDSLITVLIEANNQEKRIGECIKNARLLTEDIVVVDIGSTDRTFSVATKFGAEVFCTSYSDYVEPVRNFGIKKTKGQWVFILDPDERLSENLIKEIKKTITNINLTHFKIPRKNYFARTFWFAHGGWWPDHVIRFFKRESFIDWPQTIHSTPIIKGEVGYLSSPIIHFWRDSFEGSVNSTITFGDKESDLLFKAQRNVGILTFFRKFFGELYRRLCRHLGFLDGELGIIEAIYQAFSKTITYLFLYEKQHNRV